MYIHTCIPIQIHVPYLPKAYAYAYILYIWYIVYGTTHICKKEPLTPLHIKIAWTS